MGLISKIVGAIFGGGGNAVANVAGAFLPNAERQAQREHDLDSATLSELSSEFGRPQRGAFDRFVDGLNRLPRPVIVFACFGVLIYTPIDPERMAKVFTSWALIPAGMWSIIGLVVAFYFGGRMQLKGQDFRKQLAATARDAPAVIGAMRSIGAISPGAADTGHDAAAALHATGSAEEGNAALEDWRAASGGR